MNFSFGSLVGSLIVSGVGLVFFRYGRKKSKPLFTIFGALMFVYPYFIEDFWTMVGIAAGMCAILYWFNRDKRTGI